MKKIITAVLDDEINQELRKLEEIEVLSDDFLYQEVVLDYISEHDDIDFLIINDELPGEKITEFIKKIPKEKTIIITENTIKNKDELLQNGVIKIIEKNQNYQKKLENFILEKDYTKELEEEIEKLKLELKQGKNKFPKIKLKSKSEKQGKIISITGTNNKSKTIYLFKLYYKLKILQKKILIISTEFIETESEKRFKKKKISYDTDIKNIIFSSEKNDEKVEKIQEFLRKKQKEYDYILIKNSSETFFNINKEILKMADKIYFILEKNLREIITTKNLIDIYIKVWMISEKKIEIILNELKENKLLKKARNKLITKIPYKI